MVDFFARCPRAVRSLFCFNVCACNLFSDIILPTMHNATHTYHTQCHTRSLMYLRSAFLAGAPRPSRPLPNFPCKSSRTHSTPTPAACASRHRPGNNEHTSAITITITYHHQHDCNAEHLTHHLFHHITSTSLTYHPTPSPHTTSPLQLWRTPA